MIGLPRQQAIALPEKPARSPQLRTAPRKGWSGRNAGRAATLLRPSVFRASTAQAQGAFPFLGGAAMPMVGPVIGWDVLTRTTFTCHPVEWLHRNLVTNTNIMFTSEPGAGKSATIKALVLRLAAIGVKTLVAGDLKNEYAPLSRALGVQPVELGLGLPARLNPLDAGPLGANLPADHEAARQRLEEIHRRRVTLIDTLLTMQAGRPLTPFEKASISYALRRCSGQFSGASTLVDPTIPQVWRILANPDADFALDLGLPRADLDLAREKLEHIRHGLGNMVEGPLGGLFDAPSTVRLDFDAPIQSVDLSRLDGRGDETVAMTMACVSSWAQAAIDMPGGIRAIVRDEVWRSMRSPAMIRKIDSDLRLSRSQGTIQILSTHRLSDFEQVGAAGSAEVAIARNLIASCDTRVQLAQDTGALAMTREAIGLTDSECEHIGSWSAEHKGFALWKVGRVSSQIVRTQLTAAEQRLFYTNERMAI
ncbi:MAG TPA: type VI secretion protein [Sporichthyaceae bacterium]|nr:type VI secretion protein [Sporichthyaceae bacterium]